MQEHFHFTTDPAKLQKQYAAIFCFVSAQLSLIQMYLHRRNRHLVKQEDEGGHRRSPFRKVAWLFFRTSLASLCHGKFVHKRLVS